MSNIDSKKENVGQEKQLVAFQLGAENYGIPILQVQEIIRVSNITRIPGMPNFIEGVTNLRGKIIPIIDLRIRFSISQGTFTENTRIVVADAGGQIIGLIVDAVSEVVNLKKDQIDPMPPTITAIDAEYLAGVGKVEKHIIVILDLEKLLSDIEKVAIEQLSKREDLSVNEEKKSEK